MFNALARPSGTRLASFLPALIPEPRVDLLADAASEDGYGEPAGHMSVHFIRLGNSDGPLGILGTYKCSPTSATERVSSTLRMDFAKVGATEGQFRRRAQVHTCLACICVLDCTAHD